MAMAAQKPFEAPPEYSTDLPDLSVLRLDSPRQYGSFGDGNSHKRPSLTSINSQQPKPKKLFQSSPHSAPAPASASAQEAVSSGSGISSNAFRSAKNAPNSESATPCSAKGSVPPTGCSSLPPRPPRHRPCNSVLASPSGISSNASGLPKNAHNSESATPCSAKGYVPPTGCSSLPPRPPPLRRLKSRVLFNV
ncbi:hypothetical protein L484_001214 [Morus notabilis]|uniref:Uncharacterized protein n=1 Tax=Morus notabilis TaxID=981085 RepID=W9RDR8_9ROSA|nr:hypothetical protein L484_001214 [Morus notabilis]